MVAMLLPVGLLSVIDGDQLAIYCSAYATWVEAETQIAQDGLIVKSPNGYPIQHPALAIRNKSMEQMHKYLAKFGMNPADRARVQTSPGLPAREPGTGLESFSLSTDGDRAPLKLAGQR
jgi:P27 family predicted phage terminase small subunit